MVDPFWIVNGAASGRPPRFFLSVHGAEHSLSGGAVRKSAVWWRVGVFVFIARAKGAFYLAFLSDQRRIQALAGHANCIKDGRLPVHWRQSLTCCLCDDTVS